MRKIKDFIYNYLDLFFSLVLIVLIAFVILYNLKEITTDSKQENTNTKINITEQNNNVKTITVTVPSDTTPDQLATILKSYGIIPDEEIFLKDLLEKHPNSQIKSGDFEIKTSETFDEIYKQIIQ